MAKCIMFKDSIENLMEKCYSCEHLDGDCDGAVFKGFALMNGVMEYIPEDCEAFEICDEEEVEENDVD